MKILKTCSGWVPMITRSTLPRKTLAACCKLNENCDRPEFVAYDLLITCLKSVSKAGAPTRRPKETKVSLTKGFDLCSTFCFLEVRRWLNFAVWAAPCAAQTAKNCSTRGARGTIFRTCRAHVFKPLFKQHLRGCCKLNFANHTAFRKNETHPCVFYSCT